MFRRRLLYLCLAAALLASSACSSSSPGATPGPTASPPKSVFTPKVVPPTGEVGLPAAGPPYLLVGNTGGDGVWLRRTPAMADRLRAWPDSTPMEVVGDDKQAEGRAWKNVRDPAGNTGWIPTEYLVRPEPTPAPRSAAASQAITSEAACVRPSRVFMEYVANGLNFPGGAVAGVQAVRVGATGSQNEVWYLVSAAILGSSKGKEVIGLWATTIDPTAGVMSGTMVAANTTARDLSVWPLPAQSQERFTAADPDVRRAEQCLSVALDR